ncbi:MAG: ABC transporter ATP-binding protein [Anaerolineales bacterium]|jgi:ABC-2 type transport system ATP-binding protein|uniref:ABC transporter ATP-binding protein n=1 Tax=Candidatus Villigracilis affinis TaxID=3140682 RepID=UPI001D7B78E6|nr:ABC transporter ATP-binding protein [Anaerolineales bacterium]MBK9600942.1 ABC transporter ATP-binding protein [Anaerolineales bacterium]MBL0345317.1 ABC transporter ATP-binding protein [Anaerolineales bacterium]
MSDYLVQATNLHKSFGYTDAVDGVSLQIKAGEIYGLVGSDGAGKTTTMRLLVGALLPTQGEISICGYDVGKQAEQARSMIGYLSQRFSMYEDLTVLENIRFFAEIRGLSSTEWLPRSMEILEFVGLEKFKDRRAGQLSGGMKQKLGLASALVTRPRLLLLDEPTTGVDPVTRQDFWQLVIKLVSAREGDGVSVIISTPYMDEASRCHRVGFMKMGRIIAEDSPSNLRARLNGRVLELRGSPINTLRHVAHQDAGVEDVAAFGDKLHVRVLEGQADLIMKRLPEEIKSAGGTLTDLRAIPSTLEDVFIALSESNHD